ncbi:hypothetical protein HYALB_00001485 [Hymenoscyphus albidus]|uniref:MFS general substrate transporter n=1 Tax=Hymenoscyphus albidus TaxID=595503 RepID=A0A9N9LGT1_9HELO|nr:hypothetical protein HYALB_00001485 [Hymenoscyphus albidus]
MVANQSYNSESKPLLGPRNQDSRERNYPNFGTMNLPTQHDDDQLSDDEDCQPRCLNSWQLFCLTISMGGLQTIWTSIMSQGSPYLSSLGMSPALISLVWLSGPISGMFIQPIIGFLSDSCTYFLGPRRTFIVFGTITTSIFMLALPWTETIIRTMFLCFGWNETGANASAATQFMAAMTIWALKISLQPVQCGIRALIVDYCPTDQQHQASAYASRIIGFGSILGYASGFIDIPSLLPMFGETQFKGLCMVCCIALVATVTLQCLVIHEKRLGHNEGLQRRGECGIFGPFKQILVAAEAMPKRIWKICIVQFFAWLSWFSFMYYITTYIGDLYRQESYSFSQPTQIEATRLGTISMLSFATTAFITNTILPRFINAETPDSAQSLMSAPSKKRIYNLTLPRAWVIAHILTSVSFLLLGLTRSRWVATSLIAVLGISWALTQWAPFALIGEELAKSRQQIPRYVPLRDSDDTFDLEKAPSLSGSQDDSQTALILGLHNLAISAPQIVAAVGSSLLFWTLEHTGIVGTDAIGWLFMFGVFPAGAAAWWAWKVEKG